MRKKVAVIYPHVPHYRRPVFSELAHGSEAFDYVFFADEKAVDKSIRSEVRSDDFNMRVTPIFEMRGWVWQTGLWGAVVGAEFDTLIFLGNPYYLSTWVYALMGRFFGKRVLFWTHGWLAKDAFLKRMIRNSFYRIAHGLLLYGDRAKSMGLEYGFKEQQLRVIYNSLDYSAQRTIRISLEEASDPAHHLPDRLRKYSMYAACVARLTSQCKFELAIDALARIRECGGRELPLVLIGDGPVKAALSDYAQERGVDVVFLGALYNEWEIAPILYNARVVISPGKVGLTAMHSLAYGTPVITHGDFDHQGPEFEAITDGINGSFFHVNDVEDLAEKIIFWCSKVRTSEERQACFGIVEDRYTPRRQLELIEIAIGRR